MTTTPNSLILGAADPIKAATKRYLQSRDTAAYEAQMQKALATHHTAAFLRGVAERSAGGKVRAWLSKVTGISVLSKEDKASLKARITDQFGFLKEFIDTASSLSDAQVAARAALYAGATQATYWGAHYPGLDAVPGDGSTECKSNCRCHLEERDGGIWWVLGSAEHCAGCEENAAASPYQA